MPDTARTDALWTLSATRVVDLLRKREITPEEALQSAADRVDAVNPTVNALPTLCFDRAREAARRRSTAPPARDTLCGLPLAIKDSVPVADTRCTYGSLVFKDNIARTSDAIVRTLERNGGIVFAKSNTPEFEAGANTFNEVFGATRNPWNTAWSAGGSSGGAAVAVATGMAWLAQGTDFACSLRNPASFSGVVGLRPSLGRVAQGPNRSPFQTLSVSGPIARTVQDCGLFLDAMCGTDDADPFAHIPPEPGHFLAAASHPARAPRAAFSASLGITPVDPAVSDILQSAIGKLAQDGVDLQEIRPDVSEAHMAFRTLRALQFATTWGHLLPDHRDLLKPDVVWNIEEGKALSAEAIVRAEHARMRIRATLIDSLQHHEFLILPTSIVPPFPLTQRYVETCDGEPFANYLEWMAIAYVITLTGCPAISIPAGFTIRKQPVGLQIVGRPGQEDRLLSFAAYAETLFGAALAQPITPADP